MTSAGQPLVQFETVSKRFASTTAIDRLDLSIAAGEFVTFLGPSGCGKSTTLRVLGGFETPDEGRVILDGADVTRLPPNRRDVNMVFQDYALFPHMTVARNIAFGLELQAKSRDSINRRVSELLDFLELGGLRDRTPDQLSGGQRQRVALARALARDPKLLLLDEPLGALDAKLRAQLQVELKQIQKRTGKTFLFVTHDQEEALTMSDRIVVMNGGRVEQDGTPEDLYFRPRNRFVAEFIGETNLIRGIVEDGAADDITLDWHGLSIAGNRQNQAHARGDRVTGSLRLENVRCSADKPEGPNAIPGKVVNRIFRGSRTSLDIRIADAEDATLRAYVDADAASRIPDGSMWVSWMPWHLSILHD